MKDQLFPHYKLAIGLLVDFVNSTTCISIEQVCASLGTLVFF